MTLSSSLLTIAELAARSGVASSALRHYETLGLIRATRSNGNQRRCARSTLRRVAVVKAARAMGVPLAGIGAALRALPDARDPTAADWQRMSRRWHQELGQRIAVLEKLRADLAGCIGCGCLSLQRCKLFNPDDRAGASGSGPRYLLPDVAPDATPVPAPRRRR